MSLTEDVRDLLPQLGYSILLEPEQVKVQHMGHNPLTGVLMNLVFAAGLVYLGYASESQTVIFLGIFTLFIPFIRDRIKMPDQWIVIEDQDTLKIQSGYTRIRAFTISQIQGLKVDESVKNNNRDFHYTFSFKYGKKFIPMMHIITRRDSQEDIKLIFDYLQKILHLNTPKH